MYVETGLIDHKYRTFDPGNVVDGSARVVDDVVLNETLFDYPPGFENAVAKRGLGFGGLYEKGLNKTEDGVSFSGDSSIDGNLSLVGNVIQSDVDFDVACECKMKILNKINAARKKRDGTGVKSGYAASSLVWGKIMSHPWWPGQIFDVADSSKEALRHYKEGKLLVAYFGDRTFAWTDIMQLKPFQLHFARLENQSDEETFRCAVDCALDEVCKRVEFGLSCTCLPEDVYVDIQSQIVENAGVYKKSRRRELEDECSSVECFVPSKLVSYVKEAAQFSKGFIDRLELVKSKAQLASFCRWKGYRKLPEFADFRVLLVDNSKLSSVHDREVLMVPANKAHHLLPSKFIMTEDRGDNLYKRKGRPKSSLTAMQKKKKISDLMDDDDELYVPPNFVKAKTKGKHKVSKKAPSPENELGTKARKPRKKKMVKNVLTIDKTKNSRCLTHPVSTEAKKSIDEESIKNSDKRISEDGYKISPSELVEDSSCTAQIVPDISANKSSMDLHDVLGSDLAEHSTTVVLPVLGSDQKSQYISGSYEPAEGVLDIPAKQVPGNNKDKLMRTALLLKFSDQHPVPSVTDLNKIFGCYGALHESETKIMKRSVARVIFKRSCDAEAAFSSAGKYKTFGPSLISYRLKYLNAKPENTSSQAKKRRKKAAANE